MSGEPKVSDAFRAFMTEASRHSEAWGKAVERLADASALDPKTAGLAYLSVLAALRLHSGLAFHVTVAKKAGASRDEVISALLLGLPAAGLGVTQALPEALAAYDGT